MADPPSSTPNHHPVETHIGSAPSQEGAEGSREDTREAETEDTSLGNVKERLQTAASQFQFPTEPQESLGQASSTSSRLLGGITATTESTSGASVATETSLSGVSDRRGQVRASSFRFGHFECEDSRILA